MVSVRDWQSYQASVLAQCGGGTTLLYRPCREHPARVTYCKPDDSAGDHKRLAVISRPGLTGLFPVLPCSVSLSGRLGQRLVPALAGEEPLLVKLFTGSAPAVKLPEQLPGDHGHGLVSHHFLLLFFTMVVRSVQTFFLDQGQGNVLQHLAEQPSALFADLVLPLEGAALPGSQIAGGGTVGSFSRNLCRISSICVVIFSFLSTCWK